MLEDAIGVRVGTMHLGPVNSSMQRVHVAGVFFPVRAL